MITLPRIVVFCSGKSSFQTIQLLALEKYLAGVVVVNKDKDNTKILKAFCKGGEIPFFNIDNRKELEGLLNRIESINPDAVFSIGFPYRLSKQMLNVVPERFINFHMGKLPEYRGPMPLFETLKAGEKETAVTIHQMNEAFDEGDIIFEETFEISEGETFGSLAVKFADHISLAAQNLAQMLQFGSRLPARKQEFSSSYNFYPGLKETTIRWEAMRAEEVIDLCNACNPWNIGADTNYQKKALKIISASKADYTHSVEPGTILNIETNKPVSIACIDGEAIEVTVSFSDWGIEPAYSLFQRIAKPGTFLGNQERINILNNLKMSKTNIVN